MAFLLYFIVILVSAASVLFGLDLMSSPLPSTPNLPIGRSAQLAPAHVAKPVREAKRDADSRALSPVHPTHPDKPTAPVQAQSQTQPQTNGSATREAAVAQTKPAPSVPPAREQQASSAPVQEPAPAPAWQQASSAPANAAASTELPAPTASARNTAPQPALAQSKGRCDVQACAAAYHSFRASDCSYLPYPGARQVCTRSGGGASVAARPPRTKTAYAARWAEPPSTAREAGDKHELDEVTRIVRKMTRGREGDVAVHDSQGRIIIVHPGNARAYVDDFGD